MTPMWGDERMSDVARRLADQYVHLRTFLLEVAEALDAKEPNT